MHYLFQVFEEKVMEREEKLIARQSEVSFVTNNCILISAPNLNIDSTDYFFIASIMTTQWVWSCIIHLGFVLLSNLEF